MPCSGLDAVSTPPVLMRRSRLLLLPCAALFAAMLTAAAAHAQAPFAAAPLGAPPGASRHAWAAAAALSRGIGLAAELIPAQLGVDDEQRAATIAKAGFRSVRLAVKGASLESGPPGAAPSQDRIRRLDRLIDAFLS